MKTPEQIAREVIEAHYGLGTEWEEPNEYGEEGFTRAQAESDIDADDIRKLIEEAIEADRAQRRISFNSLDHMLNAWENYDGDVSGFMEAWLDYFNEGILVPEWAKA